MTTLTIDFTFGPEATRHALGEEYERDWVQHLGPSAIILTRQLARIEAQLLAPTVQLDADQLATACGFAAVQLERTLDRLVKFGRAVLVGERHYAVNLSVPAELPRRFARRHVPLMSAIQLHVVKEAG